VATVDIVLDALLKDWQSKERLFGVVAMGLGMITREQLDECLRIQREEADEGHLLGTIMLDRGYLTEKQIQEVLAAQKRMREDPTCDNSEAE
jgi:aspartate ammonia-lyase